MSWDVARVTPADLDITARTVWGEARSESWPGRLAVAWVVVNRAVQGGWWGDTPARVCRKPYQFSCWNRNDPNRALLDQLTLATDGTLRGCMAATVAALFHLEDDPTGGSTHYFAQSIPAPVWAKGRTPTAVIGNHRFFRGIS